VRISAFADSTGPASASEVSEHTSPLAGLTPTRTSAVIRGLFQWRDTLGRSDLKPYRDRSLPCGPGLTASESETSLAFELTNNAQTAPATNAVPNEEETCALEPELCLRRHDSPRRGP